MRRDLVSASALILIGVAYSLYAALALPLGSLTQMGPGMFPLGLGILLALFGVGILVPALVDFDTIPKVDLKVLAAVMGSIAAFALAIRTLGLIPALVASTVIASLVMPKRNWVTVLILCVALSLLAWLLFVVLLGIRMPLFQWRL